MAVNLGNIFNLAAVSSPLSDSSNNKPTQKKELLADEEKTNALKSLVGVMPKGAFKPKSYLLTSEGIGLFKTEETGNPSTKRRIGEYTQVKKMTQSHSYLAFLSENKLVVFEKMALQDENPKAYLEVPVQSVSDFEINDEFLTIEDKNAALLVGLREKKLVFKGSQTNDDKCKGIGKPILCKTELAFFHFSSSGSINRYGRLVTPGQKSLPPTTENLPPIANLDSQLSQETYLSPDFQLQEEISLPKGFKISSVNLADNDRLLLLILTKKLILVLSKRLKPEGEFPLDIQEVHEAQIKVSPDGKNALFLLTNFFDETLRSYYGENFLYLVGTTEGKLVKVPTVSGPIHNFTWSKNGEEFLVFSGHMPSHAIFYNQFGEPKIELGVLYANFGKFSPDRRYLAVGASGNLSSSLLIYDNQQLKIVSEVKPITGAKFKWLPDSRRFTLSTCQDKLKVDNQVSMFRLTGEQLMKIDYSDGQLIECMYCWEGSAEKDVQFYVEGEGNAEKPVKVKKIMNLKTTDAIENIFKKESREIKFISEVHIAEVNEAIKKAQKVKDEEKESKAKAKGKEEVVPKVVVLQKGANFGLPRVAKVEDENGQGEGRRDDRKSKMGRKRSTVDGLGDGEVADSEREEKRQKRLSLMKKKQPQETVENEFVPKMGDPVRRSSLALPKTDPKQPKKSPRKSKLKPNDHRNYINEFEVTMEQPKN